MSISRETFDTVLKNTVSRKTHLKFYVFFILYNANIFILTANLPCQPRILKYIRKKKGYTIRGTQLVLTTLVCVEHVRPILSGRYEPVVGRL